MPTNLLAPHRWIKPHDSAEDFLIDFLDGLWAGYRARMEHVTDYEELIQSHGARFFNDHVAFRCLATQHPGSGIHSISRPFEALGYVPAGCYEFPDKKLTSIHFQPPRPELPKLFISQLKTWELSPENRRILQKTIGDHRAPVPDEVLADLHRMDRVAKSRRAEIMNILLRHHQTLPWDLPQKKDVLTLDEESQFGAWTLLNGYAVNHFTASVDSHGVPALDDIEKVQAAMKAAGVPMKKEIEGAPGDRLRQTATEAVVVPTKVRDGKRTLEIPWTYAYFEIAQRPLIKNPATGRLERFEGFLGAQASNLFEMTRTPGPHR